MNDTKSIKKNFVYNTALTVTTMLMPLITFPYISRVLLVEATGKVDFAISLVNYFIMFSALGIPTYGIRACAVVRDDREKLSRTVHELLFINLFMTGCTYFVFLISIFIIPRLAQEKGLMIIAGFNLLLNAFGMNWLYSAVEDYRYITIRSLIVKGLSFICVFLFLHSPKDYKIYALILVISTVGSNIFNFIHSNKYVTYKFYGNYCIKMHLRPILTFFATTVAISVYSNLDIVMLGFISGDREVGYYSAALKIRSALATLAVSLGTVLLPRLSYLAQKKQISEFKTMLKKSFNYMFLMAIPITFYFVIYARPVVLFLSGKAFEGAISTTQLLVPTVFFAGLSNVTGTQTLVPLGKEKILLKSIVAGAIVDFILNCILIQYFGSDGAAFSTLITEIVVLVIQCIALKDLLKEISVLKFMIKPLISASIASLICIQFILEVSGNLAQIMISVTIFGLVYALILLITHEPLVLEIVNNFRRKLK